MRTNFKHTNFNKNFKWFSTSKFGLCMSKNISDNVLK